MCFMAVLRDFTEPVEDESDDDDPAMLSPFLLCFPIVFVTFLLFHLLASSICVSVCCVSSCCTFACCMFPCCVLACCAAICAAASAAICAASPNDDDDAVAVCVVASPFGLILFFSCFDCCIDLYASSSVAVAPIPIVGSAMRSSQGVCSVALLANMILSAVLLYVAILCSHEV